MYRVIAEQPVVLTLILLAFTAGSLWTWMQTGKRGGLIAGGVFLTLVPVGLYVSSILVTDRETLKASIRDVADGLQAGDHERVLSYIDPRADQAVQAARHELPKYEFLRAQVNNFQKFEIRQDLDPTEAIVTFIVDIVVTHRGGEFAEVHVPRKLVVHFRKSGDAWRILQYTHKPIVGKSDNFSPNGGQEPTF